LSQDDDAKCPSHGNPLDVAARCYRETRAPHEEMK
jgi:hypothetical protein